MLKLSLLGVYSGHICKENVEISLSVGLFRYILGKFRELMILF